MDIFCFQIGIQVISIIQNSLLKSLEILTIQDYSLLPRVQFITIYWSQFIARNIFSWNISGKVKVFSTIYAI